MENNKISPSFAQSALTFGLIVATIGIGLFILNISLHSLMLVCLVIGVFSAWRLTGGDFNSIRNAMNDGISRAFGAIYIFILIGVLVAAFIQSGTVATLIYYGLEFISPAVFLPAGLVLCAFMSVATGTSWGTVGTAGVVLIGMGGAMDIPLAIVAGVVVSGACFGDKMSPVSDTTNLAAMSSEVDLYKHIRSMAYTTGPTFLIVLVIYAVIGMQFADNAMSVDRVNAMIEALDNTYSINLFCLLPFIVMIALTAAKVSAEPAMVAAAATAIVLAIFLQGADPVAVMNALYSGGGKGSTGIEALDGLLGRGGISSMMWTLSLALMALALGGILYGFGFLQTLISVVLVRVKSAFSLVTSTIVACLVGNMTMGEAYMSIILGGQLFGTAYDEKGIDRSVMSRCLEEGATLTTVMIPWTTGGAFFAATLGVSVLDYAPWALLNWMNPIIAILFALFGLFIFKAKPKQEEPATSEPAAAAAG